MFAAGSSIGNMSCQYITINNDNITEYDETFSVTLSASLPVLISPITTFSATIDDNDGEDDFTLAFESFTMFFYSFFSVIEIAFEQASYVVQEGSNLTLCVEIVSGYLERTVAVYIMTSDITATMGIYNLIKSMTRGHIAIWLVMQI